MICYEIKNIYITVNSWKFGTLCYLQFLLVDDAEKSNPN